MEESADERPDAVRPLRLSRVAVLVVLIFLVGGVVYLVVATRSHVTADVEVLVPVHVIRPFRVIEPQDLGIRRVRVEPGRNYLRLRDTVEGRYALSLLRPDQPITEDRLGPIAPAGLNASFVFTVEGGAPVSLAGKLTRGDRVDVLSRGQPGGRVQHAYVLDVRSLGPGKWSVTLCSNQPFDPPQTALLTGGHVSLLRLPEP